MKRKTISYILALFLVIGILPSVAIAKNASSKFADINQGKWYVPYVDYVVERGLMAGVSSNKFEPDLTVTRAQFIQTLYALAEKPEPRTRAPFTDVKNNAYYVNAVNWASENRVTGGMSPTKFGPNYALNREQAATFFYAYSNHIAKIKMTESNNLSSFPDRKKVSKYASTAMKWAVGAKLIAGLKQPNGALLQPQGVLTRAQLATMLKAFDSYLKNRDDDSKRLKRPDNLSDEEAYYWDNSEVIKVVDSKKSKDALNDKETVSLLEDLGFKDNPVTYEYNNSGDYLNETPVEKNSTAKHPMYETYYMSSSGVAWSIFVINGQVFANPASFNLVSDLKAQLLISETKELTSYENSSNKYYVTIPNDSEVIVKVVKKINAETLDKLSIKEIKKL